MIYLLKQSNPELCSFYDSIIHDVFLVNIENHSLMHHVLIIF